MTEHAAVIFVFFFLAEYASIVLICILTSILFLGGYLYDCEPLGYLLELFYLYDYIIELGYVDDLVDLNNNSLISNYLEGL